MSVTYTRPITEEEKDEMATKKKAAAVTETKERAAVSRERRLALALVAVIDAYAEVPAGEATDAVEEAETSANELLKELGYNNLESIPKQLTRLNAELTVAIEAGDYGKVAELGKELQKAKAGKFHKESVKVDAAQV